MVDKTAVFSLSVELSRQFNRQRLTRMRRAFDLSKGDLYQETVRLLLVQYEITASGTGYTDDTVLTFSAPDQEDGIPTTGIAQINDSGGISGVTITTKGSGYTTPPTVTITGSGTGAIITAEIDQTDNKSFSSFFAAYTEGRTISLDLTIAGVSLTIPLNGFIFLPGSGSIIVNNRDLSQTVETRLLYS